MIKRLILFLIAGLIVLAIVLWQFRAEPLDILADLEEIRNTPTETGNQLNQYYANSDYFDSLVNSGKYEAAIEFIDEVINSNLYSNFQDNYIFEKGKLLFNLEYYEEAKSVLTEAIYVSDSSNVKSFVWRGYSYALLGSCDSALVDLAFAANRNSSFQQDYDKILKYCGE